MKPRDIARAVIVTGWLTGMILILAGQPFPLAFAALAVATAAAVAFLRWWGRLRARLATAAIRLRRRSPKTGGAFERA